MTQLLNALSISPYWLLRIPAVLLALIYAISKRKSFNMTLLGTFSVAIFVFFGVVVGAKSFYLVGQIMMHGSEATFWTLSNWSVMVKAGGVLYGSVFGAFGMILLFAKIFEHKTMDILALASVIFFGANFFCRIGCFLSGCCYGVQMSNGHLFPYQLAEGLICALIFIVFLIWEPEKKHKELLFPLFMILYSTVRFVLEFFRGDESRGIWLLSTSQWIALILIPIGIVWWIKAIKKKRDTVPAEAAA